MGFRICGHPNAPPFNAPNAADYRDWLAHRPNAELATLTSETVIDDICVSVTAPPSG